MKEVLRTKPACFHRLHPSLFRPFTPASGMEGKWLVFKELLSGGLHKLAGIAHGLNLKHNPETLQGANTDYKSI